MFPYIHTHKQDSRHSYCPHTGTHTDRGAHIHIHKQEHALRHTHLRTAQPSPADISAGSLYKGEWEAESYFRTRKDESVHVCACMCVCMAIVPIWIYIGAAAVCVGLL